MLSELEIITDHTFQTLIGLCLDINGQRVLSCHKWMVGNNDTLIYNKTVYNQRVYTITFFFSLLQSIIIEIMWKSTKLNFTKSSIKRV
jgi:hypothetical protein